MGSWKVGTYEVVQMLRNKNKGTRFEKNFDQTDNLLFDSNT